MVGAAYEKDMKAGLLIHRITDAERNEIDLAESLGPAARLDQAKQEFKSLKEKAEHYVTADGRKIGGDQVERGDFFTFLNKLLKHELKRADDNMTKEVLRQKNEQIKDESVKAEWRAVVASSNRLPEDMDDLTTFRKKKEKRLADARPQTAPIRKHGQSAAEFQAWPGNQWGNVPRGLAAHRSHSAKIREKVGGRPKSAALVPGSRAFGEFEFQPATDRKWACVLKLDFRMNQKKLVVGRSDACDVKLDKYSCTREDLKAISREHCTVVIDDYGTMTIKDHSGNGTLVNNLLLKHGDDTADPDSCPLAVGDSVTFGGHASECKYVLAINEKPAALSRIDASKLRGHEQVAEGATDSVKQSMILAGDVKLAARESHRAWALWSGAETAIKDISAVKTLVVFASAGSPHQCAHAAAALHSLSKDPSGINLVINAGGVSALSTLAAVNDEFIDGLESCREEAILGLRSLIMRSAQGRERVAKEGALRMLIKIAGNSDDPMRYLADEAVREFEAIEEREKEERAAKADAKNRGARMCSPFSRPRTADSSTSRVSTDGASNANTDIYTMASSRPSSALHYPQGWSSVGGAKMEYDRSNIFRPQSAAVVRTSHSRPESADLVKNDGITQKQVRPVSAAMIMTQQQYCQETVRRPIMYKKEYISTDEHQEAVPSRHAASTRPGDVHSMIHKKKLYYAYERSDREVEGNDSNSELSATKKHLEDISEYDSYYALSAEARAKTKRKYKKDVYMPAIPRGPVDGSSSSGFTASKEAQDYGQKFLIDGIYREYLKPDGLPRDIESLLDHSVRTNASQDKQPERVSAPSSAIDEEQNMQIGEGERFKNSSSSSNLHTGDKPGPWEPFAKEEVGRATTRRNLQRPESAEPKDRASVPQSPLPVMRARPASAAGVAGSPEWSTWNAPSTRSTLGSHATADFQREQVTASEDPDQARGLDNALSPSSQKQLSGSAEPQLFITAPLETIEPVLQMPRDAGEGMSHRPHSSGRFARPSTPGGLMPIFERAESSLDDSRQMNASLERSSSADVSEEAVLMPPDRLSVAQVGNGQWSALIASVAPIWGLMCDECFALDHLVGRFFSEEQILNLVQNIHDKAIKEASSHEQGAALNLYQGTEFQRFLSANMQHVSQANRIDYFALTEMLAPDLIGRHALQLYDAVKDKTQEGVSVAELQHALKLANLSDEDVLRISGVHRLEYSPGAADAYGQGRRKFSAIYQAILGMISPDDADIFTGPEQQHDQRRWLEHALLAACESIAHVSSLDLAAHDADSVPISTEFEDMEDSTGVAKAKSSKSPRGGDSLRTLDSRYAGEEERAEGGAVNANAEDSPDVYSDSGDEEEIIDSTIFDVALSASDLKDDVFSRNLLPDSLPQRPRFSAQSGSRRPGSTFSFRPQSASSRPPSSSMREAALPESSRQPSPQPYAARLQELEAAVTAKESEAAELRKRMRDMSNEFNAHLFASESGPMEIMEISAGVVNQPQVRAQSAPQNARNRLLSRGLPSSAATPATVSAVASASTTAPHSGATTAAPSGVQTPLLLDNNRNDEEELRYKQALVRALEKSYLSEVGKLQREIQQLSSKCQDISERPATASGVYPHRSTATVGVVDGADTFSPTLVGSPSPSIQRSAVALSSPLGDQRAQSRVLRSEGPLGGEATGLKQAGGDKEGVRQRERQALLSDSERKARARALSAVGGGSGVSRLNQRPSTATSLLQLTPNRSLGLDVRPWTADRPSGTWK